MSSHLSVSYTASNGATVTKSLGQAQDTASNAAEGILGMFAALLNQNGDGATNASQSSNSTAEIKLAGLIGLSLKAGSGDPAATTDKKTNTDPSIDPSTVVVPVATVTPLQQPLADLVETLTAVGDSLAKGEAPAPALLEKLNQKLDSLAQSLGVPAATTPSFVDLLALATAPLPAGASVDQHLNQKFAELAQNLLATAPQQPATTELSQNVGAKLAALAKSLGDGTIGADTLAKLGLTSGAPNKDPARESAIARLLGAAPVKAADTKAAPALAAPTLSPTEAGLTATAATKPAPAASANDGADSSLTPTIGTATATADASTNGSDTKKHPDDKKSDLPDIAAVVATKSDVVDKDTSKAGANQLGIQNASRVEAPATARVPTTAYQTNQQQINLPQIAFEMVRQVQHGNSRFQIRLDPPELGRIDVRLDIDKGGTVNARLFVEKSETLDLMQRDQRALQQALQQAGLDSSKTNLEFSLRQNNSGQHNQQARGGEQLPNFSDTVAEDTPPPTVNLYRGSLSASGLNILA